MAQVKFYIEKRRDKQKRLIVDNVPIILNYSFSGKRLIYYTRERVDAENWDPVHMRVRAVVKDYETIRNNLDILKQRVQKLNTDAKALNIKPTVKYFRDNLKSLDGTDPSIVNKDSITIESVIIEYLEKVKSENASNTLRVINTSLNHLKDYIIRVGGRVSFSDIDQDFIERFKKYMHVFRDKDGKELENEDGSLQYRMNNTIIKNLDGIRNFLSWCKRKNHFHNLIEWGDLDMKVSDTEVIFLTLDEIKHLISLKFDKPHLEAVRDVFVFGCFTGQRHEDLKNLRKVDIKENDIRFHIKKGGKTTLNSVSLVPVTRGILQKYSSLPGDSALPVLSNQKMNENLKTIMKKAGFNEIITIAHKRGDGKIVKMDYEKWQLIGCHVWRKSFITNAIARGMDEIVIKSLTGHSKNSKAFGRYYEVVHERKHTEMQKAFTF